MALAVEPPRHIQSGATPMSARKDTRRTPLTGCHWGLRRKQAMIGWEAGRTPRGV
jgi:hypothetical protein